MKRKPRKREAAKTETDDYCKTLGVFPTTREHLARQAEVLSDPNLPHREIDHQSFGTEVEILEELRMVLFDTLDELEFHQVIDANDPRRLGWRPVLGDDPNSQLAWELIGRVIEDSVIPFGRGMFAQAVLWAADKSSAEIQAAAKVIQAQRENAHKGGEARRKKAGPRHAAIRARFNELNHGETGVGPIYRQLAEEFGLSERHVQRIVNAEP